MLSNAKIAARLPAENLERAKAFYAEKLGLEPVEERDGGLRYVDPRGAEFALFQSAGAPSGDHTQMGWEVADIEATVAELGARGVVFEEYDMPGLRQRGEPAGDRAAAPRLILAQGRSEAAVPGREVVVILDVVGNWSR